MTALMHCTRKVISTFDNSTIFPPIEKTTTIEQWDYIQEKFEKYSQEDVFTVVNKNGDMVLHQTARVGNLLLMEHCVLSRGEDLLSLGDDFGWTPLQRAVEHNQEEAAATLLALGAPVNIMSNKQRKIEGSSISICTALWYAAEITHNIGMCKMLLRYSAKAYPTLREGAKILEQAQSELIKEALILESTTNMPMVIIQIVKSYLPYPDVYLKKV